MTIPFRRVGVGLNRIGKVWPLEGVRLGIMAHTNTTGSVVAFGLGMALDLVGLESVVSPEMLSISAMAQRKPAAETSLDPFGCGVMPEASALGAGSLERSADLG